ncbi:MAG: isoprenylcysteine carboxylmethyltransferase family protein [Chloroflexi bacterium]|nr:MAG: isoprenylcysteine carboxylmethyltransferase family protein [Chloroflexota bacterium]
MAAKRPFSAKIKDDMEKEKPPWWQGPRGEGYVIIQFMLFGIVFFAPKSWPGWPAWMPPWSIMGIVIGLLLGGVGGLLILAGLMSLGGNLTAVPRPIENGKMVRSGAYKLVRHPIYSGIIIGAVGYALLQNGIFTLGYALILFFFFDIKSRREEQWLCEKYADYPVYQQQVKKLIPFVY